jgi:site-specific recombinase XerD
LNRATVYRAFKKVGIFDLLNNNNKLTVTHLPRHAMAAQMFNKNSDISTIQDILHHNSIKSQIHYEPIKRNQSSRKVSKDIDRKSI